MPRIASSLTLLLIFFISCENPITFVWDISVTTDTNEYQIEQYALVSLHNNSEKDIYFPLCGSSINYRLEKQKIGDWIVAYLPPCPEIIEYEKLSPGVQRSDSLLIFVDENLVEEITGTYRFVIHLYSKENNRLILLPDQYGRSNIFNLTE